MRGFTVAIALSLSILGASVPTEAFSRGEIVSHPPGCPKRAFCGCGAALKVYGQHRRELWLARNWFKFPSASPAPNMVAVRRGHVFVILEVRDGRTVLAYDANSGGGKTRVHLRSLAGYSVRNPHAYSSYAEAKR